jgi:hypothetical protein
MGISGLLPVERHHQTLARDFAGKTVAIDGWLAVQETYSCAKLCENELREQVRFLQHRQLECCAVLSVRTPNGAHSESLHAGMSHCMSRIHLLTRHDA